MKKHIYLDMIALLLVIFAAGCSRGTMQKLTQEPSDKMEVNSEAAPTIEAENVADPSEDVASAAEAERPSSFTPLSNDGSYDITQPLQEWELTRTNGIQTGMTREDVEKISGKLSANAARTILHDAQNVAYRFWQTDSGTLLLMELNWNATVENDELIYEPEQDVPAFRDICLGDSIGEVLSKFPCADKDLEKQKIYVYGQDNPDDYCVLNLVADSYYSMSFYINGHWRASIDFSRVQQRVFHIAIFSENYWQVEE